MAMRNPFPDAAPMAEEGGTDTALEEKIAPLLEMEKEVCERLPKENGKETSWKHSIVPLQVLKSGEPDIAVYEPDAPNMSEVVSAETAAWSKSRKDHTANPCFAIINVFGAQTTS